MIAYIIINNKRLISMVTESGKRLNISLAFIAQSYFKVPKDVRLNSTHYFIMKIEKIKESFNKLQLIVC